jgi:outer membrane protein assembly factor BamA
VEIKLFLSFLFFSFLCPYNTCFAETPTASQIERSQELLEKEQILKNKLEKKDKVFIKKITVKGVTILTEDKIKEIILPFQKHWLTKKDIQQILDLLAQAYKQEGYAGKPPNTSFQIKKSNLEIQIGESK